VEGGSFGSVQENPPFPLIVAPPPYRATCRTVRRWGPHVVIKGKVDRLV